ncbi:MAG: hypothetical protein ACIAQF_00825 [Phycisphaerales bacterium JB065]
MNWIVFSIFAWVAIAFETGFRDALALGSSPVSPSLAMILVAFVALWAPIRHALPAAIIIGLLLDFGDLVRTPAGEPVVVLGRHAIGCLLASYTVVTMRGMMFRKNIITIVVLSGVTMALTQVLAISMLKFRSLYDIVIVDDAASQLGSQLGSALYTAALAFVIGPVLNSMKWLFGFTGSGRSNFRMP